MIAKTKMKVKTRSISDTQANSMMVTSRKITMTEKAYLMVTRDPPFLC